MPAYEQLDGDPVFDYLKKQLDLPGRTILGGLITENKSPDPLSPRVIIEVSYEYETEKNGGKIKKTDTVKYNYKKILRQIKDQMRRETYQNTEASR